MAEKLDAILSGIEAQGSITGSDIIDLRRNVFGDNHVCMAEAERLFRLNDSQVEKAPGWADFFVAAITNMMIRQTAPIGYVEEGQAKWLIEKISADGHIEGETEFRTLFRVLNEAMDATDVLVDFALAEVKAALVDGIGYMGRQRQYEPRHISLDDVKMIERVLYASGGDGNVRVTETEAEILFDINDSCEAELDAADAWQSLFINAVTNSVMFYSPFKMASKEEMLQNEDWVNSRGGFVSSMVAAPNPVGAFADFFGLTARKELHAYEKKEKQIQKHRDEAERIVEYEAKWLTTRLSRDGVLNENERALLRHLDKMCPDIHHSLRSFIEAAA